MSHPRSRTLKVFQIYAVHNSEEQGNNFALDHPLLGLIIRTRNKLHPQRTASCRDINLQTTNFVDYWFMK